MIADFRSDTVTRPDDRMRAAMAAAEVGDDVFGDDPTVLRLEARAAELFGKQAALYCPTGTMANQIAIGVQTRPGDEVLMEERAHTFHFEVGGAARLWGVQPRLYPSVRGTPDVDVVVPLVRADNVHLARTTLCLVENTNNFHGGTVVPLGAMQALRAALPDTVAIHLDGARLWNAHVASGTSLAAFASVANTVMVALSKGLGCPAGSLLVGDADFILEARRTRKLRGGGMRQVGVRAATALVALDAGFDHLAADHARAKRIADALGVDPETVDTNIVMAEFEDAAAAEASFRDQGVLVVAIDPRRIRVVTHRDVGDREVDQLCKVAATLR